MEEPEARGRLLNIMHVVPIDRADNAGQNFAAALMLHWARKWRVMSLIIPGRSAKLDAGLETTPITIMPSVDEQISRGVTDRVWWRLRGWFPSLPDRRVAQHLRREDAARELVKQAEIVVLQWEHTAAIAGVVRHINPNGTIVAVLHDVVSQSHMRYADAAISAKSRLRHRVAEIVAKFVERYICRRADAIIVLSSKDKHLLPRSAQTKVHIVPAPIDAPSHVDRHPVAGRILIVSSWRYENVHGLSWFTDEVLPRLRSQGAQFEVHLIGRMEPELRKQFEAENYVVRGFVEDLAQEYAQAAVAAVPLFIGAGVKFKTVEALLHRVPVVSTPVGAEGIPALAGSENVTVDPEHFANQLASALNNPSAAQARADELRATAAAAHSKQEFAHALEAALQPRSPQAPAVG